LTGASSRLIFPFVTTTLTPERQIVLPKKLCVERKLQAGDHFEVIPDEDDANVILLRRVKPEGGDDLLEMLLRCPVKGFMPRLKRRKEPMRKVRL
jgi:bifunctional DNA-binding transcriptional regulator/antitoxin component of YhaV-PrlF toxin-antitoxin module